MGFIPILTLSKSVGNRRHDVLRVFCLRAPCFTFFRQRTASSPVHFALDSQLLFTLRIKSVPIPLKNNIFNFPIKHFYS